jgi:foldase protein PrsA
MKPTRIVLVSALMCALLAGSLASTGCSNKNVAAKVNGEAISTDSLNTQIDQLKKQYPNMFTGADGEGRLLDFKQRLLDNLINAALIKQAAKQKGITVSDAEVQKQIDQLRAGFKDDAQFQAALKSAGMTLDTLKEQIKSQVVTNKLIQTLASSQQVTQAEIQAYYNKNKAQFAQKAQKRASHILFKPSDKATAQKVLSQLKAGTITFAAAAKKYSTDTASAANGGDLGWPTTAYVPEFQAALDALKKNQMSGLVQSTYGWHIIKVTDTRPAMQSPLSAVKTQIQQIILQQRKADAYQKFLDQLRRDAKIQILLPDLQANGSKSGSTATSSAK